MIYEEQKSNRNMETVGDNVKAANCLIAFGGSSSNLTRSFDNGLT